MRFQLLFTLPFAVVLACGPASASTINLGSISMNDIVVLGYPSTGNVQVNTTAGGQINVGGNVASPTISNVGELNFVGGGPITSGSILTNAETALTGAGGVISQITSQTFSPTELMLTSGAVNVISTAGNYVISTGTLGPGTVIDLMGAGQYVFEAVSAGSLDFNGVTINPEAPGLTADNVFWYTTGSLTIDNSQAFGDFVENNGTSALSTLQTSGSVTGNLTGRILSVSTVDLNALTGSTLNIDIPEPASLNFVWLGLGSLLLAARRRWGR